MSDTTFDRWPDAERILDEVIDLPEPERAERVRARCGSDDALRIQVEHLLSYVTPPAGVPAFTPPAEVMAEALSELEARPSRVGPYRLLEEIGRGGMGRVFRAVRDEGGPAVPVAVKLLDAAIISPDRRARFDREHQTLSRLQHPNIARLLDAGVGADGTPYLVMELVEGPSVDRYVTDRGLDIRARLRLFLQVCAAVAHAHARLVLHRDLKPANVLIDTHGHAKLLDFGIAKWLEEEGGPAVTRTMQRPLTPAYAAPEQVIGQPLSVATDIYQLGLVLFELLTGTRAQPDTGTGSTSLHAAVVERDVPPPSTRASGTDARHLAGDLDAIVLKALRKDPAERYPTVDALMRDLEAHLAEQPVSARRGTALYLVRKYVRRHRAGVATAASLALALGAGAAGTAWQARQTAAERDRAATAERRAAAVNDFIVRELLSSAAPERSRGTPLTVGEVLDAASTAVGRAFAGDPVVEADTRQTLARTYLSLGRSTEARQHANAAERLLAGRSEADPAAIWRARALSAALSLDEGKYDEARRRLEQVRSAQLSLVGDAHPDTIETRLLLVRALLGLTEDRAAEAEAQAALRDLSARPDAWRMRAELQLGLATAVRRQDRVAEAESLVREVVSTLTARLGPDHPGLLAPLGELTGALTAQLKYREALAVTEQSLAVHRRVYGDRHPLTGLAWLDLSVAYDRAFRDADALAAAEQAYDVLRTSRGEDHPDTLRALRNIGVWHRLGGDIARAEPIYRRVLDVRLRTLGETHRSTRESRADLLALLNAAGRPAEAARVASEIRRVYDGLVVRADATAALLEDFADFLLTVEPASLRDPKRALELATRAIALSNRRQYRPLRTAALAHEAMGDGPRAIDLLQESLALPDALPSWTTEARLVRLLTQANRHADAERFLHDRLARFRAVRGPDERLAFRTMQHLARLAGTTGRPDEAERWWREALAHVDRTTPEPNFQVGLAMADLGLFLAERGRLAEAEPLLREAYPLIEDRRRVGPEWRGRVGDALVHVYTALGRESDAARWRQRRAG